MATTDCYQVFQVYEVLLNEIELLLSINLLISNLVSYSKRHMFVRFRVGNCKKTLRFNTVSYGEMAEILSNGTGTLFAFHSKWKFVNICLMMYYPGSTFDLNMQNIILLLLILKETWMCKLE